MSKYEEGRADRSAGKDKAPHSGVASALSSPFRSEREQKSRDTETAQWREGWHDKDREIRQDKKKS